MLLARFLDPKNDFAFKKLFGTEKNKNLLINFLNGVLDVASPVRDVVFLKPAQDPDVASKKQSIVDVLCQDQRGAQYIVEMQVAHSDAFIKRAQFYAAKAYGAQLQVGDHYETLKPVIFLAITDFIMFPDKEEYKSDHVILDKDTYERDLKDFSFTFIELPKFHKQINELANSEDKWLYFFKHAPNGDAENLIKLAEDAIIAQAYTVLNRCFWSDGEIAAYEQELKNDLDARAIMDYAVKTSRAEGRAEGIAQGRLEEKRSLVKAMIAKGLDFSMIAGILGMPIQDIESIMQP